MDAAGSVSSVFTIADRHPRRHRRPRRTGCGKEAARPVHREHPDTLSYLDRGCMRASSKGGSTITGISADNAVGHTSAKCAVKRSWLEQQPGYEKALAGGAVHFSRLVDGLVDGPRWMRTSYVPDFDEAGFVIGVYTVTTDVHDLTVAQDKLRRSVERDALTDVLRVAAP
ncbi:MAG: PAS domain-containing protein [Betaproteobacteria bacterium]|nr:PAS domain-containing protein [Betaproteobacteria bacterium]